MTGKAFLVCVESADSTPFLFWVGKFFSSFWREKPKKTSNSSLNAQDDHKVSLRQRTNLLTFARGDRGVFDGWSTLVMLTIPGFLFGRAHIVVHLAINSAYSFLGCFSLRWFMRLAGFFPLRVTPQPSTMHSLLPFTQLNLKNLNTGCDKNFNLPCFP